MPITIARLLVEIGANSDAARAELTGIGNELQGYGTKMMQTGALMMAGLSVPLTMLGKKVTDLARDYQENMNVLGAVTEATGAQMTQLGTLAQELGADLKLPGTSAGDAASAMVELGKAGLNVTDVMGAARGVLELSAAGNLENARAAEIASNALNAFGLAGTEASRVADLLAAGANTSSAEVEDMADGFQMASAVFASSGRSIEDLTAMLAMMANAGIKGSDAGTSLKQMLLSLQAPTNKAKNLMEELDIEIYNAHGEMLGSDEIIANFAESLGGLSEAQRNSALATIFGSDAVRAANVVLMAGESEFLKAKDAVDDFGAAAKLAGARVEGLPGSLDAMESSLQTLGTNLGNAATKPIAELAETVTGLANAFADLPDGVQENIVRLGMLAIAAGPTMTAFGGLTKAVGGMISFLPTAVGGVKGLSAAFSLMQGAKSFGGALSVAKLGIAGITSVAIPAAAALVAIGAAYDKFIVKTTEAGTEMVSSALTDYYQGIIDKGANAADVLASFNQQQQVFNQQKAGSGIAGAFIDWNSQAENNLRAVSTALLQTTTSADEYQTAMMKAFGSSGLDFYSAAWGRADETGKAYDEMVRKGIALSAADYDLARAEIAAGGSAQQAAAGITGMAEAALGSTGGLNALSTQAQGYMSQLDLLADAQQSLNTQMSDWVQGAASQAVSSMSGLNVEGDRYLKGLQAIDEVMGTNHYQQQLLTNGLNDLGEEYQKTGDIDAYKAGLEELRDEGLKPFYDQLDDVTTRAQELYDKLTGLPSEVLINVNFSVNGEPNWAALGINTSGKPETILQDYDRITAHAQASGGDWWVTEPALFLAGEAGPERATFTPAGKEGQDPGMVFNFYPGAFQVSGNVDTPMLAKLLATDVAREIRRRRL